jgi:hypothetical protein
VISGIGFEIFVTVENIDYLDLHAGARCISPSHNPTIAITDTGCVGGDWLPILEEGLGGRRNFKPVLWAGIQNKGVKGEGSRYLNAI